MARTLRPQNQCKHLPAVNAKAKKKRAKRKTVKIRNEILKKKAEKQRLRRLNIKNDPVAYKQYLESEKMRYEKRKKDGKVKIVAEMTLAEKRSLRRRNKISQQACRQRKKESEELNSKQNSLLKNRSKQKRKTVKIKSEILKKKAEKERLRRLKIKNDPVAYKQYLESEKMRYEKRKKDGKIKTVAEMTLAEKRSVRKRNRKSQRLCRQRKKELEALDLLNNYQSKQDIVEKKRTKKRRCYKVNGNLGINNTSIKNKIRIKLKTSREDNSSAIHIVNTFLKSVNAVVPEKVKKHLIFSEVMKQQIKTSCQESTDTTYKRILKNNLSGAIIKKYRVFDKVRKTKVPLSYKKVASKLHKDISNLTDTKI